jgi:hypothetical protein
MQDPAPSVFQQTTATSSQVKIMSMLLLFVVEQGRLRCGGGYIEICVERRAVGERKRAMFGARVVSQAGGVRSVIFGCGEWAV